MRSGARCCAALCILSVLSRGTWEQPGLALGLVRGGSCRGFAFRIAAKQWPIFQPALWAREMSNAVYEPKTLPVTLEGGDRIHALVFVARPEHSRYRGDMPQDEAAALVAQGVGTYGTALDYLRNVVRHLDDFGVADCPLQRVLTIAETYTSERRG